MRKMALLTLLAALLAACGQSTPAPSAVPVTLAQVETLSEAQIRALSSEQVEALGREAEANLQAAALPAPELSAQADARWPNYAYTLYAATSISYESYLSSVYRQYGGPDWTDDGCSGPTPPVMFDTTACLHHDFGYRNVAQYAEGRRDEVRKLVDERFLSDMYLSCDRRWPRWFETVQRTACKTTALIFYSGVRVGGSSAYYDTPQRY